MRLEHVLRRNSPLIWGGLAIASGVTAVIMAAKAGPKAQKALDDAWCDEGYTNTFKEKVRTVAPIYATTVAMTTIFVTSVIMANSAHRRQLAVLGTLLSISEKNLMEWQESALGVVGAKKFEKIREKYIHPKESPPTSLVYETDDVLCFDHYNGRYFRAKNIETLNRAANLTNEEMLMEDYVPANDFYGFLNLPKSQDGDDIGWWMEDGLLTLVFDATLVDDEPCIIMTFNRKPRRI